LPGALPYLAFLLLDIGLKPGICIQSGGMELAKAFQSRCRNLETQPKRTIRRIAKRFEGALRCGFFFVQNKEPLKQRTSNPCPQ
jgi:hypothetical protein